MAIRKRWHRRRHLTEAFARIFENFLQIATAYERSEESTDSVVVVDDHDDKIDDVG